MQQNRSKFAIVIKNKMSVFLVLWISFTACNICQCAIFVSVQYRKILHTCIPLIYMAIYFSHTIKDTTSKALPGNNKTFDDIITMRFL